MQKVKEFNSKLKNSKINDWKLKHKKSNKKLKKETKNIIGKTRREITKNNKKQKEKRLIGN